MKLNELTQEYIESIYKIDYTNKDNASIAIYKLTKLGINLDSIKDDLLEFGKVYNRKCDEISALVFDVLPEDLKSKISDQPRWFFPIIKNDNIEVSFGSGRAVFSIYYNIKTGMTSYNKYLGSEVSKDIVDALQIQIVNVI